VRGGRPGDHHPDEAAHVMMAAVTGVALSLISQPSTLTVRPYPNQSRSRTSGTAGSERSADRRVDSLKSVALQMAALMRSNCTPLTDPELSTTAGNSPLFDGWFLGAVATLL
jgi:hypothetical protein